MGLGRRGEEENGFERRIEVAIHVFFFVCALFLCVCVLKRERVGSLFVNVSGKRGSERELCDLVGIWRREM